MKDKEKSIEEEISERFVDSIDEIVESNTKDSEGRKKLVDDIWSEHKIEPLEIDLKEAKKFIDGEIKFTNFAYDLGQRHGIKEYDFSKNND